MRAMRFGFVGLVAVVALISILLFKPFSPVSAVDSTNTSAVITINMTTTETVLAVELSLSEWDLGNVTANATYYTDPPLEWCTINNTGNVDEIIRIKGENAREIDGSYQWMLSNDGTNDQHGGSSGSSWDEYVLWYKISHDGDSYTIVNATESEMINSLAPDATKQFGLKLLSPESFSLYSKKVQTHITISAVAA